MSEVIPLLTAVFPGGSMVGAPKKRTLDIIEKMERHRRGVYSGSLGYVSVSGEADLNIVIRTAVITPNKISVGAGGAITALSDVIDEYDEMLIKAKSVIAPIQHYFQDVFKTSVSIRG
eukprot:GHVN01044504.1.p1 GENE.GHVN01044504.1~~GHVN01044504.1.p1  ORF type:complete len:118 (-),score=25.43 GHVN01044504.1:296-649(-)